MQIYDVTVRFSRTIQVREYEPASAEVTIKAQLAENEKADVAVGESFKLVSEQVHLALGLPANTSLPKRGRATATAEATPPASGAAAPKTEAAKPAAQTTAAPKAAQNDDIPDSAPAAASAKTTAAKNDDIPDSVPTNVPSGQPSQGQPAAFEQLTAAELSKWIGEQVKTGKVTSAAIVSLYSRFGVSRFADLKPEKCGEAKAAIEQLIQGGAAVL